MIGLIKKQSADLFAELERVDWPKKDEVMSTTWVVVVTSIFCGLFLFATDWLLGHGFALFMPHGN